MIPNPSDQPFLFPTKLSAGTDEDGHILLELHVGKDLPYRVALSREGAELLATELHGAIASLHN